MKKFYVLPLLFLFLTTGSMWGADKDFTMDKIRTWVGNGAQKAAFAITWNGSNVEDSSLVWGYKWDGTATGYDMLASIAKEDPRFYAVVHENLLFGGYEVLGIGYDIDNHGKTGVKYGDTELYPIDGIIKISSNENIDQYTALDTNDYWKCGWRVNGYWKYFVKENDSDRFSDSMVGSGANTLTDGCWDGYSFTGPFPATEALPPHFFAQVPNPDYTQGVFIVNEDKKGSINYLYNDGSFLNRIYQRENYGKTLGVTTQFGTIYGGNFYLTSKQAPRLVVADAKTLKMKVSLDAIGKGDGRAFLGYNDTTGYVSTSDGIYLFDLSSLTVKEKIAGISGSVGTMIHAGNYVFAEQKDGIIVLKEHKYLKTITESGLTFSSMTQSLDGSIWVGAANKLLKIDPYTLMTEVISLPNGVSISFDSFAWKPTGLCASTKTNTLYFVSGASQWEPDLIYRYEIGNIESLNTPFYTVPEESPIRFLYGSGLRVDPVTDNLYITLTETGWGDHYKQNWVYIINPDGTLHSSNKQEEYAWFPAMPVFPDNATPVAKDFEPLTLAKNNVPVAIQLQGMATDADNLDAAITHSIVNVGNTALTNASISGDTLYIRTAPEMDGTSSVIVRFNSNGKIIDKTLFVTVGNGLGIENSHTENHITVSGKTITVSDFANGTIYIYSAAGQMVAGRNISENQETFTIEVPAGIYLIKGDLYGTSIQQKIILR